MIKSKLLFNPAPCYEMEFAGGKDTCNAFRECDGIR